MLYAEQVGICELVVTESGHFALISLICRPWPRLTYLWLLRLNPYQLLLDLDVGRLLRGRDGRLPVGRSLLDLERLRGDVSATHVHLPRSNRLLARKSLHSLERGKPQRVHGSVGATENLLLLLIS